MNRREYALLITVNGRKITKVIIDAHYEKRHKGSINDKIILDLVKLLDGGIFPVQEQTGVYKYFVTDKLKLAGKLYKLIWLLEDDQLYVGVINAYRR